MNKEMNTNNNDKTVKDPIDFDFSDENELKRAIIASEILNRKY